MTRIHRQITLGHRLQSVSLPELSVSEVEYGPRRSIAEHGHEHANISLVLSGAFDETIDRITHRATACSLVFKPAHLLHHDRFGPHGARLLVIELKPDRARGRQWSRVFDGPPWVRDVTLAAIGLNVYRSFCRCVDGDEGAACRLQSEVENLLEARARQEPQSRVLGPPAWLAPARRRLLESGRPRVRDVAAMADVHPVYFARVFRRHFRCSAREYRRRQAVMWAAELLSCSDLALANVARTVGFADQSHLCREFRRELRVTPTGIPPSDAARMRLQTFKTLRFGPHKVRP